MEYNFKWKNNGRTKLCIGLGTRPEIIRLAAVIKRCREYFDTCVIYYNQKYSLQGTTQGNGLTGGLPPVRFSM